MTDKQGSSPNRRRLADSWPIAYKWLAVGTVVAYSAVGTTTFSVANAQELPVVFSPSALADTVGAMPARRFQITAGPLGVVLESFRAATSVTVALGQPKIADVQSPGVSGVFTDEQALKQLLSGTGVTYEFTDKTSVTLELAGLNTSVEVTERLSLTSPKYTAPLRDIPQTVVVLPKSLIEEQGATTLRDVLRNVPGLTIAAGEGGVAAGDNLNLRGFSARNDIFIDGSRDLGPQSRDPFNLEQVEVVKGPQSALAGRGSTGGVVNMVSKNPNLNPTYSGTFMAGTDSTRRVTADINVPLARVGLGERTALRLNALAHHSDVAGRNVTESNRWGLAPSLAFGLGTPTRLTVSYFKLKQDNIPDYGIPWVPAANNALPQYRDQPAPVARETFYGLRDRDFERINSDTATVRVEHDFSDGIGIRSQFRYGRSTRDSLTTAPRFVNNESTSIDRGVRSWITRDSILDSQTDFTTRFSTGSLRHSLVAGLNISNENNLRRTRTFTGPSVTTLNNPNTDDPYTGTSTIAPIAGDVTGNTQAAYLFDSVRLNQHWEATGGLRWERFAVDGVTAATGAPIIRTDRMTSGRAALIFKPVEKASLYASWGTSLNPSLEGLSYGTANTNIEPEKTYTIEAGAKVDVLGERLQVTGAIFRVSKTNARTPGVLPDEPPQVLQGRQRVSGVELGASGSLARNWRLYGAYTYLDSEIEKSNTPAEIGKEFQNTPRHSMSMWTTYQMRRLMLGGGPRFVGSRFGNNINTRSVGSYWTLDILAAYRITSRVDLRFNLYNLNDAFYFDRLSGGHLVPGAARSANISTSFRF